MTENDNVVDAAGRFRARAGVLLVDDNLDFVVTLAQEIEEAGYPVRTAHDGCEALDLVAQAMPGLVLLDFRMPGMDGFKFERELRDRYGRGACEIAWLHKRGGLHLDDVLATVERHLGAPRSA